MSGLPTLGDYPNCKLCGAHPVMIPDSVSKPPYIVCDTHSCAMRTAPTTGDEWIKIMEVVT